MRARTTIDVSRAATLVRTDRPRAVHGSTLRSLAAERREPRTFSSARVRTEVRTPSETRGGAPFAHA